MTLNALDAKLRDGGPQRSGDFRSVLLRDLRARLERDRANAEATLAKTCGGMACARSLSLAMDKLVDHARTRVMAHLVHEGLIDGTSGPTIVATGGYGRGTLAPGSDVDLLFLMRDGPDPASTLVTERVLYALWDLKLKVGHATRTVEECVKEAMNDMTIRTALLETRLITGDSGLYERFCTRFSRKVIKGSAAQFVDAKLRERETRVSRAGNSRYLVEPNVKDGKGGLRDLNTLFWISRYVYGISTPEDGVAAGLFTQEEAQIFARCEEFLWRVRCHLHFVTGRAEERLSFDAQRIVAQRLGFEGRPGLSGVERFMKAYFSIAKQVGDLTAIVCAGLEARHAKKKPVLDRVLGPFRGRRKHLDHPDFRIDNDRITLADPNGFERDPVNLLRIFWMADRHNLPIHPDATSLVSRSLRLVGQKLRANEEANRLFVEILTSRKAPETVLRRMNEAGLLGRFIPDFGRVVSMMQFNMYHHYTVDEHLLRSIGVLAEIDAQRLEQEHPLANGIVHGIRRRRALYVAMLLHDIAKGRPEDHSIAGEAIARKLGPRLGLDATETELAAWLVRHHLLMSTVAQSRDLSDPKTISSFAEVVGSVERLKMLLVLTIADIKAVGPGVWTGWKGQLLRTLFNETEVFLTGGESDRFRPERLRAIQKSLREALSDWSPESIDRYVDRFYPFYWFKTPLDRQIDHARFIHAMERDGLSGSTRVRTDAFRGVTELTIASPDHPRLLAIITGACAAAGGNIVDAQIFTSADGLALDTICLSRAFDQDEDEIRRAERVASAVERALRSEIRISDLVANRRASKKVPGAFVVPSEVVIDNELSSRHTVIEVSGLDRPGLLYELTTALGQLNLNIASAHIATFGERAADVFYVTDLLGTKITQGSRHSAIRRCLKPILDGGRP